MDGGDGISMHRHRAERGRDRPRYRRCRVHGGEVGFVLNYCRKNKDEVELNMAFVSKAADGH